MIMMYLIINIKVTLTAKKKVQITLKSGHPDPTSCIASLVYAVVLAAAEQTIHCRSQPANLRSLSPGGKVRVTISWLQDLHSSARVTYMEWSGVEG